MSLEHSGGKGVGETDGWGANYNYNITGKHRKCYYINHDSFLLVFRNNQTYILTAHLYYLQLNTKSSNRINGLLSLFAGFPIVRLLIPFRTRWICIIVTLHLTTIAKCSKIDIKCMFTSHRINVKNVTFSRVLATTAVPMGCLSLLLEPQGSEYTPNVFWKLLLNRDSLCGLVVRVLGYRSGSPGSIPGTTRKKNVEVLERGALSLVSTTEELLDRKVAAPV
jgi:hypothetical protein